MQSLLSEFKDPPKEYTVIPFWFINKLTDRARLSWQVKEMFDKGVYGFFIHARRGLEVPDPIKPPRAPLTRRFGILSLALAGLWWDKYFMKERKRKQTPYLADEWWGMVSDILEEGEKRGMEIGVYDELDWPSGTAGMTIPRERRFRAKYLDPSGEIVEDDNYINAMDPRATDKFIKVTHEAYRKRFGKLFGKLIKYFYSDEVTLSHHLRAFWPRGLAPLDGPA